MTKTNVRVLRVCSLLVVVTLGQGCSERGRNGVDVKTNSLAISNGLITNGLITNGLITNGLITNGLITNGLITNGLITNGLITNGLITNGLITNGLWLASTWQPGLTGNAAVPGDMLRSNPYLRELLPYMFACAMPPTTYDTVLDPNNGALKCSSSDAGADGGAACDDGYTCSSGTCVIPLKGAVGVGINADGTSWGASGHCDQTCQRWVSACLLARTNAYGKHVEISMRAPASAPQAIRDALPVGDRERSACPPGDQDPVTCGYTLPEGAYYGNLFAATPVNPQPGPTVGPDGGVVLYSGPVIGPSKFTPSLNACAGPGSNIPEITNRFCSSQGDQSVINVPGTCLATSESGVCAGKDANGVIEDCSDSAVGSAIGPSSGSHPATHYAEVITVFLKKPSATHGDGVCEDGEESSVTADGLPNPLYDPSDCPPGWAKDFPPDDGFGNGIVDSDPNNPAVAAAQGMSAVGPDGTIVVVGKTTHNIDLKGGTTCIPAGAGDGGVPVNSPDCLWASDGEGVLAEYAPDGKYLWGIRFQPDPAPGADFGWDISGGVTVDASGNIIVLGKTVYLTDAVAIGDPILYKANASSIWVRTFSSGNTSTPSGVTSTGPTAEGHYHADIGNYTTPKDPNNPTAPEPHHNDLTLTRAVALDPNGDVVVAAGYCGWLTFYNADGSGPTYVSNFDYCDPQYYSAGMTMKPDGTPEANGMLVAKISSAGTVWVRQLDDASTTSDGFAGLSMAIDSAHDNDIVLLTGGLGASLQKLSTSDGHDLWRKTAGTNAVYTVASVDPNDDVYVGGYFQAGQDFGCGAGALNSVAGLPPFLMKVTGNTTFVPDATGQSGETIFGGKCLWETHANIVCPPGSPEVNGIPTCGGSMDQASAPLVAGLSIGFDPNHNVILGSFGNPTISPQNPSVGGGGGISFGSALATFSTYHSNNIFLSGYRPDTGQVLWAKQVQTILSSYLLGMGVDSQYHIVTSGNYSGSMLANNRLLVTGRPEDHAIVDSFLASFGGPVLTDKIAPAVGTFVDETGKTINTVPKHIVAQATGKDGANVFFVMPTASDDPSDSNHAGISVVCSPRPNTVFPVGDTPVTCTASDPLGNHSSASFTVTVTDRAGPVFSPYADITAQAISGSGVTVPYPPPTAIDQVAGAVTPVCLPTSGSLFPIGKTTVTCTASDHATPPNASQMTFFVNVTPPPITVSCVGTSSSPVSVSTSSGLCGATISNGGVGGTCSGGAIMPTCTFDGLPSETLPLGTHSVAVVGTVSGSTASCTSYVKVVDKQKPVVTCANQQVECAGNGGTTLTPTASCTDNCSCTTSCAAALFPVGTSSGSCTATDAAGNSATCQGSIKVVDTKPPTTTATVGPSKTADVTVNITLTSYSVTPKGGGTAVTGTASCWTSPGIAIALSAVDACAQKQITYALTGAQTGGATVTGGTATVTVTTSGGTSVSYFATDKAGNVETARTIPIFVGKGTQGFGFSCAPSPSLKSLPPHGTATAKGTVTLTVGKLKVTQPFSFTQTY